MFHKQQDMDGEYFLHVPSKLHETTFDFGSHALFIFICIVHFLFLLMIKSIVRPVFHELWVLLRSFKSLSVSLITV